MKQSLKPVTSKNQADPQSNVLGCGMKTGHNWTLMSFVNGLAIARVQLRGYAQTNPIARHLTACKVNCRVVGMRKFNTFNKVNCNSTTQRNEAATNLTRGR